MKRHLTLLIVLLVIIGAIFFLESQKARPGAGDITGAEIDIEAVLTESETDTEHSNESSGSALTDLLDPDQQAAQTETAARIAEKRKKFEPAKEITSPDGFINVAQFYNTELSIEDFIGERVILVDFWTYSCINCQRTLPYLNSWYEKYADEGLVIVGLHTPEFEFEKDMENVERAVEKWGIEYPVVLDNDYSTWRSYKNRYWPRKYLIDIDGFIVYDHIGEGAYEETEAKIVELLNERNQVLGISDTVTIDKREPQDIDDVDFTQARTPETYLGSARVTEQFGNLRSRDCFGQPCEYFVPPVKDILLNQFHFTRNWQVNPEESVLLEEGGSIFLRFKGSKVNLVAGSETGVQAEIYLNQELILPQQSGEHVTNSTVLFQEHDLYNLVDLQGNYEEHLLEIRFTEPGVSVFAFTFG